MQANDEPSRSKAFWRMTPPAIFPPLLGSLGIGLAWRQASAQYGVPNWIAETILSIAGLIFLFAFFSYCLKVLARAGTFFEDLQNIPGRAGLPAASASFFLIAAALIPYNSSMAKVFLLVGLVLHFIVAAFTLLTFLRGPRGILKVTPVWHLTFVSFIIAPVAAIPLGWSTLSHAIYAVTLPIAIVFWGISLLQICRSPVPEPLRPLLAIHMAPLGLFTIVSALMGYEQAAIVFAWLLLAGGSVYLSQVKYLVAAGFSPAWGAFTFPMAAFANAMFCTANFSSVPFRFVAGVEMVAATIIVAMIAFKIGRLALRGTLSKLTQTSQV